MADPVTVLSELMSHHAPEFRRGDGPDALPQGAATQANAAAVTARETPTPEGTLPPNAGSEQAGGGAPLGPSPSGASPPAAPFSPGNDEEKFLVGPSQQPTEPLQPMPTLTADQFGDLPFTLLRAAQSADATPALKALARAVYIAEGLSRQQ